MKLHMQCAMVTIVTLGVKAMSSNTRGVRGQQHASLLREFHRHLDPVPDHDVGPMLKSAESMLMDLASRHESAPLADLVNQIKPFIVDMQNSIMAAHSSAQQTLNNYVSDFSGCETAKSTGESEAASLQNTKTGHSNGHKSCRTAQKSVHDQHTACESTLTALEQAKVLACDTLEGAKLDPTHGCKDVQSNPGETWKSYVVKAADWFAANRDDYLRKEAVCNNETAKFEAQKTTCLGPDGSSGGQKKVFEDKKAECDAIQSQLESAACSHVTKVDDTCSSFSSCTNTVVDGYESQSVGFQAQETQRKVEWNATERLLCMLGAYGDDGSVDPSKLQSCQHIADNTTHLTLARPSLTRPAQCPALLPHPCGADYISQEYGSLDAPAGDCTACAFAPGGGAPAGGGATGGWVILARQTMPFLFAQNQWSLNPTDPSNDNYAILDKLEDFRVNGKFEFKLLWPQDGLLEMHWTQTSNPVGMTGGVSGYESISTPYTGDQHWGGLEGGNGHCLLDGSVDSGNWFFAVGTRTEWQGGIPPNYKDNGNSASQVELWVKAQAGGSASAPVSGGNGPAAGSAPGAWLHLNVATIAATASDGDLIHNWPAANNAAMDFIAHDASNDVEFKTSGPYSGRPALVFTGMHKLCTSSYPVLKQLTVFFKGTFVKDTQTHPATNWCQVVGQGDSDYWNIRRWNGESKMVMYTRSKDEPAAAIVEEEPVILVGTISTDGTRTMKAYKDSDMSVIDSQTATGASAIPDQSYPICIGTTDQYYGHNWDFTQFRGEYEQVVVYDHVLAQQDITQVVNSLHNQQVPTEVTDPGR